MSGAGNEDLAIIRLRLAWSWPASSAHIIQSAEIDAVWWSRPCSWSW